MNTSDGMAQAFVGLLVDSKDDWSATIERAVLVIKDDIIVDRAEVLHFINFKYTYLLMKIYIVKSTNL